MNYTSSDPVFIVGMNGSGTTMLLDCLNNHPHLFGFRRETKILPYYIDNIDNYGDLKYEHNWLRLLNDLRMEIVFRLANGGFPPPLFENWQTSTRSLAAAFDMVINYFAARENKRRWCEKTPLYGIYIKQISKHFPTAKFIHIVRDGRDCAASLHRRWGIKPEFSIYKWKHIVSETRKQGNDIGPSRYFEIYYEELISNPYRTMQSICKFLNEPFTESLCTCSRIRVFTGNTNKKIINQKEKYLAYFNGRQIGRLEKIAGKYLAEMNYTIASAPSDTDPNKILLLCWYYYGYIRDRIKTMFKALAMRDIDSIKRLFLQSKTHIRTRYKI